MQNGGAPRVLIIPGLNGDPGMLLRAAPLLFPTWQPVAFNHHHDPADGGVEGLAERALACLTETDEPDPLPVFICGESFGGTVALTLARIVPERVAGLLLFSTFGWYPSALARRGLGALAVWSYLGGRVSGSVYQASRLVSVPSQLGLRFSSDVFRDYVDRPRSDIEAYRTKAQLSLTFDARPWLGSIQAPAFVLTGRWDPVVPVSAGHQLARAIPNTTLHTLGGGHLVHLVNADRVGKLIAEWADRAVG